MFGLWFHEFSWTSQRSITQCWSKMRNCTSSWIAIFSLTLKTLQRNSLVMIASNIKCFSEQNGKRRSRRIACLDLLLSGHDSNLGYTKSDGKGRLKGDAKSRNQVFLPKRILGYCGPLALETNGNMPFRTIKARRNEEPRNFIFFYAQVPYFLERSCKIASRKWWIYSQPCLVDALPKRQLRLIVKLATV